MKNHVYDLRCEYRENPLGLDPEKPRFSWKIGSGERNIRQAGYRIQVFGGEDGEKQVWDSGPVLSPQSLHIPYGGDTLQPESRYRYRVRVSLDRGDETEWSPFAYWETGLMSPNRWLADWISPPVSPLSPEPGADDPVPLMRKEFILSGKILRARLSVSALGLYKIRLNGEEITEDLLTPGWTVYRKRLQYQTYDVTPFLSEGTNTAAALLGNGWYRGYLGWEYKKAFFGERLGLLFQLKVTYADGREESILSDGTWKTSDGAIRSSEIYHGEVYDANREQEGWDRNGFDDRSWNPAERLDYGRETLVAQENVPVRRQEEVAPAALITTPKGERVLDFGQNMVGWVKFRVRGQKGDRVILRHAEILDREGNFYLGNIRKALQKIDYTLKGGEEEVFEPTFTFQGFRYVRLDEFPGEPRPEQFTGVVIHSHMAEAGHFSCSDPLVNQLQHNIQWGQKGNFVDVPTDCPQRDERLGWTGDAQVFAPTACFNRDSALFFAKWLADVEAEQRPNGSVPETVPALPDLFMAEDSGCGWGDAAVIVPWTLYLQYGDRDLLKKQYPSMKAYVEYIRSRARDNLWNTGFHFGDWLALDAEEGSYLGATPNDLTATAFYAYSTEILRKTAVVLGEEEDIGEYEGLHRSILRAFREEFVTPRGRLLSETQTAHVLALHFNLVEEKDRPRIIQSLISLLRENNWHLKTGFLGTPYLCHVLSSNGHADAAYKLVLQRDYPSWLYPITKGATTIWEHWDGIKPDGSLWSDNMNSFNHYAYGAVGEWLYKSVAGIGETEEGPGYALVRMEPLPCRALTKAEASHDSPYGKIVSSWEITGGSMVWELEIPPNSEADLLFPCLKGPVNDEREGQVITPDPCGRLRIGSGSYRFSYPLDAEALPELPPEREKKPWEN